MLKNTILLTAGVACCTLGFAGRANAQVNFVLSAPGVQTSPVQGNLGALTETFNSFSTGAMPTSGSLAVGSYTTNTSPNTTTISNADQYGGAGGTGRYPLFGPAPTTQFLSIDLTPTKYLGFWWSAGNAGNQVKIYNNSTLLGTFDSVTLTNLLGSYNSPTSVVAADGKTYSSALYFGNPNPNFLGNNLNDPYAYVNLTLTDPLLTFTKIEFSGGNFEFDNVTTSPDYFVPGTPAPGPLPILGAGAAFGWTRRLRRRISQRG